MLNDESIQKFKDIFEKEYGRKFTWQEAADAAYNLVGFFELLLKIDRKEKLRKLKLKEHPKGFLVKGSYCCRICGQHATDDELWYDRNGMKCMLCQKAVEQRIVPVKACKDENSWYSMSDLSDYYGLPTATARKLAREGKLKARIVLRADGKPHFYVFMIKDNPKLKNPKPRVRAIRNGDTITAKYPEKMKLTL